MAKKNQRKNHKVINIGSARKVKEVKDSLSSLLTDTRKVALAIQDKTCLLCHTKKMCVNLTGLCASCYDSLSAKEKLIADREAQHKTIEITVTDDRWDDTDA